MTSAERLNKKLEKAEEYGLFVDVSDLDTNGTGAKIVDYLGDPTNMYVGDPTKMYVDSINMVSDNFLGYERACMLLGDMSYYDDLEDKYSKQSMISARNKLEKMLDKTRHRKILLDVSNIDSYGNGSRTIAYPGSKSNKFIIDELNMSSNDFPSLERAMVILGLSETHLFEGLEEAYFDNILG